MGGGLSSYVVGRETCAACHAKPAARGRSHDRQAEMTHLLQARNGLVFKPWGVGCQARWRQNWGDQPGVARRIVGARKDMDETGAQRDYVRHHSQQDLG